MRVALLTLTRDRLAYTQHCFQTLQENAGCEFHHYVVDQASTDGTDAWLDAEYEAGRVHAFSILTENIGICRALNLMLDEELNPAEYDVIVRFDNDCEVLQPDTLLAVCELALRKDAILAPTVRGLRNPPAVLSTFGDTREEWAIDEVHHLGGIFMAIPAHLFSDHGYRYDETRNLWEGDELICPWWRSHGGRVGYLRGYDVNHYLTTEGQVADIPAYFERRVLEGGPAR